VLAKISDLIKAGPLTSLLLLVQTNESREVLFHIRTGPLSKVAVISMPSLITLLASSKSFASSRVWYGVISTVLYLEINVAGDKDILVKICIIQVNKLSNCVHRSRHR